MTRSIFAIASCSRTPHAIMLRSPAHLASYRVFPLVHYYRNAYRACATAATTVSPAPAADIILDLSFTSEPCIFPDLLEASKPPILVGIDPDRQGALAALSWPQLSSLSRCSALSLTAAATVRMYDMPTDTWKLAKREKIHPSPEGLLTLIDTIAVNENARATTLHHQTVYGDGGAKTVHTPEGALVRAAVEFTTPQHLSGKYAWYGNGFATGLFTGLLLSRGIEHSRVPAVTWKRQLGLKGLGKEGSLALARHLFPQCADVYLKRKKDHGRAEALLIAAWALGVRAQLLPCCGL